MKDRNGNHRLQQQQKAVSRCADQSRTVDFSNVLTSPELLEITEAHLPEHRERLYPPMVTLSMFINQVLDADGSCQGAVNRWAAQRVVEGLSPRSVATGGYCRARQRLPLALVKTLACETGRLLCAQSAQHWQWRGRKVKLVDGTGLSMPDTRISSVGRGLPVDLCTIPSDQPSPLRRGEELWTTIKPLPTVLPHSYAYRSQGPQVQIANITILTKNH